MIVQLPDYLQQAIESIAPPRVPLLAKAAYELSSQYRRKAPLLDGYFLSSEDHRLAYLLTRFPATFSALTSVFLEAKRRFSSPQLLHTLLDLGAGPGTTMWAAAEVFPTLTHATCVEHNPGFSSLGVKISPFSPFDFVQNATWEKKNMTHFLPSHSYDLVVSSYALGELPEGPSLEVVKKAWMATTHLFIIIEPGTPSGFERIRAVRDTLLQEDAFLLAPCPHQENCPIRGKDWCHFSQRLERTQFHRLAKEAELMYEDEKYSYLIAGKKAPVPSPDRVLSAPLKKPGHVKLKLCTQEGTIATPIISKKDKPLYKKARKTSWGETWGS